MRNRTSSPFTYTSRSAVTSTLNSGLRYSCTASVALDTAPPTDARNVQSPRAASCGSVIEPSAEPRADSRAGSAGTVLPSGPRSVTLATVASGSVQPPPGVALRANSFQFTTWPGR